MSLWGYGCHCVFLGDRPMSEMGHGHPVDELDKSCRNYKGLGLKNFHHYNIIIIILSYDIIKNNDRHEHNAVKLGPLFGAWPPETDSEK